MHSIEKEIDLLDKILEPWKKSIGDDFQAYKNHVLRILNYCFYLTTPDKEEKEILIIAAAFHNLGIWSGGKLNPDYIPQSIIDAEIYLQQYKMFDHIDDICFIIENHNKIRSIEIFPSRFLAEMFRQANLIDLSVGFLKFGVPKAYIQTVKSTFPDAGFHKKLWKLTLIQLKEDPLNPLPTVRW